MNIYLDSFQDLIKEEWNYPVIEEGRKWGIQEQLHLIAPDADVSGGTIRIEDIDRLADHPEVRSVTISGLHQDTFEYFIQTYGKQLRYINFHKNKLVEDWSLLGTLPELECVRWFHNQRITKLWDMRENYALKALVIRDFSRLHDLTGIDKAPALEWLEFGDAVWATSNLDSLQPLIDSKVRHLEFYGNKILDMDVSVIPKMKNLEVFDFPTNHYTTEDVAWLVAKCPNLQGFALRPYVERMDWNEETQQRDIPYVIIVGKRKPMLKVAGNEKRIQNYASKFEALVEKYKQEDA